MGKINDFIVKEEKVNFNTEKNKAGFEQLWVWQKAFKHMLEIHEFCKKLPGEERFKIRDQIERSSSSVCDNIAEAYMAYYYKDNIKGLLTARRETGETQNHIYKLIGKHYLNQDIAQDWIGKYGEIIRGINGFVNYLRRKAGRRR